MLGCSLIFFIPLVLQHFGADLYALITDIRIVSGNDVIAKILRFPAKTATNAAGQLFGFRANRELLTLNLLHPILHNQKISHKTLNALLVLMIEHMNFIEDTSFNRIKVLRLLSDQKLAGNSEQFAKLLDLFF